MIAGCPGHAARCSLQLRRFIRRRLVKAVAAAPGPPSVGNDSAGNKRKKSGRRNVLIAGCPGHVARCLPGLPSVAAQGPPLRSLCTGRCQAPTHYSQFFGRAGVPQFGIVVRLLPKAACRTLCLIATPPAFIVPQFAIVA